jgi:hypothetical protein
MSYSLVVELDWSLTFAWIARRFVFEVLLMLMLGMNEPVLIMLMTTQHRHIISYHIIL